MLRHLAPTGSPIKFLELLLWLKKTLTGGGDVEQLQRAVQARLGNKYSYVYSTGRGAMASLLSGVKALRSSTDVRDEVILPAYTCYSVASSVINAGLKIRLCDIEPTTLSYDLEQLKQIDFKNVLAIVSSNLYGLPNNNLVEVERLANEQGLFLVDDAAQSLNSKLAGRAVGTFGSAGILSLDKGKNVTSIQGGLVVTDNRELSDYLVDQSRELPALGLKASLIEFIKVLIYYAFLNPYAYKIPANISFSGLGETKYEPDLELRQYPVFLSSLAESQLKRIDEITQKRVVHGEYYEKNLLLSDGVTKVERAESSQPVYLRYPLLVHDTQRRARLLEQHREYGISASYPASLNNLPEIESSLVEKRDCPGADVVAKSIVTLPTHAFVRGEDMRRIVEIVNSI